MGRLTAYSDGVNKEQLNIPAARVACAEAMTTWPNEVRFMAYAGRVAVAANDNAQAARLLQVAANRGFAIAQSGMAELYSGLRGLPRNQREATRLYRLAANQGDPEGLVQLGGVAQINEAGLRPEDANAEYVRLLRLAADQGYDAAQYILGTHTLAGNYGVGKNPSEGLRLLHLAAAQGNGGAQFYLGDALEKGVEGVPPDLEEAVRFYRMVSARSAFAFMAQQALRRLGR